MAENKKRFCHQVLQIGAQSCGKTTETLREIDIAKRMGRKVLVFDASPSRDYEARKDIALIYRKENILKMREGGIYRIKPIIYDSSGNQINPMGSSELIELLEYICLNYTNGLLVMEDASSYLVGNLPKDIIGRFIMLRHSRVDTIINYHGVSYVQDKIWAATKYLKLWKQTNSLSYSSNKIPNYPAVKIAAKIVSNRAKRGLITNNPKDKYYPVTICLNPISISNCTKEEYVVAVNQCRESYKNDKNWEECWDMISFWYGGNKIHG